MAPPPSRSARYAQAGEENGNGFNRCGLMATKPTEVPSVIRYFGRTPESVKSRCKCLQTRPHSGSRATCVKKWVRKAVGESAYLFPETTAHAPMQRSAPADEGPPATWFGEERGSRGGYGSSDAGGGVGASAVGDSSAGGGAWGPSAAAGASGDTAPPSPLSGAAVALGTAPTPLSGQ